MEQQQGTKGVKLQQPRPESVLGGMEFIQNEVGGKNPFFFFKCIFQTVQPHDWDFKKEYINIGSMVSKAI